MNDSDDDGQYEEYEYTNLEQNPNEFRRRLRLFFHTDNAYEVINGRHTDTISILKRKCGQAIKEAHPDRVGTQQNTELRREMTEKYECLNEIRKLLRFKQLKIFTIYTVTFARN